MDLQSENGIELQEAEDNDVHMMSSNTTENHALEVGINRVITLVLTIVVLFAAVSNTFTIVIFWRSRNRSKYVFLLNLAVAEISCPVLNYWMVITSSYMGEWQYGIGGCRIYAFSNALFGLASIGTLTVMAIERHVKLCSSVRAKQNFHKTKRCIVVSIWLYALLMSFPPIVGWGNYVKDAYCASCTFDFYSRNLNAKSYLIFLLAFGFLLPCFIIIACYVSIFRRIRESRNAVKKMLLMKETEIILKSDETQNLMGSRAICSVCDINKARNSHLASERDTTKTETVYTVIQRLAKEEVKFAKLTLAVIVGFLICWTPYALLAIAYQFDSMTLHTTVTSAVTLIMAKSSVAINPIIYSFREKQFRKDLVQLISGPVNESSSS